jgi:hypothetical protein
MVRVITAYVNRHKEILCYFGVSDMNRNVSALGRPRKGQAEEIQRGGDQAQDRAAEKASGETVEEEALGLCPANLPRGRCRQ